MSQPAICTHELTKRYGDTIGVEDVSLEVERGEVFGFLGPNGAGKTTTIRLLLDLIRPTSGHAEILGLDCQQASISVRQAVGYLPGELALWPDATAREIAEHLAKVRGERVPRAEIERLADRLDVAMDTPVGQLSSGNKQKVGILQAFMSRPELLILDEPTRGLDPLMQRELLSLVAEAKAEGRTVFLSSHILHEVEQVCDRVAIVREGRLATVEEVDDLIHQSARRLDVVFANPPPEDVLDGLAGVRDVERGDRRLRFVLEGPIDPLLKRLSGFDIVDLRSQDPSLEEIFLRHYEDGSGGSP